MEFKAVSRYVRLSPQKAIMLIDSVKGRPVEEGLKILKFMPQKSARIIAKTIHSAVSNAAQGDDVDVDKLYIKSITADKGPHLKRFRARARGRSTRIQKRTSHISVVLSNNQTA